MLFKQQRRYNVTFLLMTVHVVPIDAASPEEARDKAWRDYNAEVARTEDEPGETVFRCGYSEENDLLTEIIVERTDRIGASIEAARVFQPDDIRLYPPRG